MNLTDYLGSTSNEFLQSLPFSRWNFIRSEDRSLPENPIYYEAPSEHIELVCGSDEQIRTIFLYPGFKDSLLDIPFESFRSQVLAHYGNPSKSGEATHHPILGSSGPWDRFSNSRFLVHIQYELTSDKVALITLMHPAFAP